MEQFMKRKHYIGDDLLKAEKIKLEISNDDELAEKIGVTRKTLNNIKNANGEGNDATLRKIAGFLKLSSINDLFEEVFIPTIKLSSDLNGAFQKRFEIAKMQASRGNVSFAIELVKGVAKVNPLIASPHFVLAQIHLLSLENKRALEEYEVAIQLANDEDIPTIQENIPQMIALAEEQDTDIIKLLYERFIEKLTEQTALVLISNYFATKDDEICSLYAFSRIEEIQS